MTTTQIPSPREGAAWEDDVLGMGPDLTLGYVVGQRRTADAAAAREMRAVTHWADLHRVGRVGSVDPVTEDALTHTVEGMRATASHAGLERQLRLAGECAFTVDEFAVADLATALGMSEAAGRAYVGQSLELRDRLPQCWTKVMDGTLPAWKGRRIAEHTIPEAPTLHVHLHLDAVQASGVEGPGPLTRRRRCSPAWTAAVVASAPARRQRSSAGSPASCRAQR